LPVWLFEAVVVRHDGGTMTAPGQICTRTQRHSHTHRRMRWGKFMAQIGGLVIAGPLATYAQQPQSAPPKRVGSCRSLLVRSPFSGAWLVRGAKLRLRLRLDGRPLGPASISLANWYPGARMCWLQLRPTL